MSLLAEDGLGTPFSTEHCLAEIYLQVWPWSIVIHETIHSGGSSQISVLLETVGKKQCASRSATTSTNLQVTSDQFLRGVQHRLHTSGQGRLLLTSSALKAARLPLPMAAKSTSAKLPPSWICLVGPNISSHQREVHHHLYTFIHTYTTSTSDVGHSHESRRIAGVVFSRRNAHDHEPGRPIRTPYRDVSIISLKHVGHLPS